MWFLDSGNLKAALCSGADFRDLTWGACRCRVISVSTRSLDLFQFCFSVAVWMAARIDPTPNVGGRIRAGDVGSMQEEGFLWTSLDMRFPSLVRGS